MCLMLQSYIVTMWQPKTMSPCPLSTKSNTRWSKITARRSRCYGSLKLGDFVLKIAPNRGSKFGSARKMLYLCIVNRWRSESHQACLNGRVATEKDAVNHERQMRDSATRCSWPKLSLIPWKTRLSESRPSSLEVCRAWVFSLVKQKHI